MKHAEIRLGVIGKAAPILPRCLQHRESAVDIGLNKISGAGYGAVNMALGGQMHDIIRLECRECVIHSSPVTYVGLKKAVIGRIFDWLEGRQISCICQFVDSENIRADLAHKITYEGRADKSGAAGN
ncbi:hypothetical protein D3C72_1357400 [compost metagenome]